MRNRCVLAVLVVALLLGVSPLRAETTIQRGIDIFTTTANGTTFIDFAKNPVPAGFFCESSAVFTQKVALKGLPLATAAPGQIWGADTVIERLDDAAFDTKGTAVTRIQFRALSMVSIAPIKTACGSFHVYVSLAGKQRVTTMKIHRTQEGGGNFVAPLAVNGRVTFIPVKPAPNKGARTLELTRSFTFPATPLPWSFRSGASTKANSVSVDTNGDQRPDTVLPGTSNFAAGFPPNRSITAKLGGGGIGACPCEPTCHYASGEQHCTMQTDNCYPVMCP